MNKYPKYTKRGVLKDIRLLRRVLLSNVDDPSQIVLPPFSMPVSKSLWCITYNKIRCSDCELKSKSAHVCTLFPVANNLKDDKLVMEVLSILENILKALNSEGGAR